ncbi:MAG: sulfatase-like hydrolase/transferase, partial [Burkholderiaceae bacterium]
FSVPQELLDLYPPDAMPLPPLFAPHQRPMHASLTHLRRIMGFRAMEDPDMLRRVTACYYALVTHLDRQIGLVLKAAEELGLLQHTRIVYTSDHGEALGAHGLFGKANLLEPGAGVPLLMCGADVPVGRVEHQPVSHVDLFPTIVEGAGLAPDVRDADLPGHSLHQMSTRTTPVFAEYHAAGSRRGAFMLRDGDDKLIAHADAPPQLFSLARDPDEAHDLASEPAAQGRLSDLQRQLHSLCDPEQVDRRARADQKAKAEYWGGNAVILKEGLLVYTPPPGVQAAMASAAD